ncbi:MAG: alpha-glycosidase [Clostridia bacterium]|nr:alpha-glycosidase [Clostridia bacterium]
MVPEAIIHNLTRDFAYPLEKNKLLIKLKIKRGDATKCTLVYWNRHRLESEGKLHAVMRCYARDFLYDYYETVIDTVEITKYIKYLFCIEDESNTVWLNYYGVSEKEPEDGFFEYNYTNDNDVFRTPDWVSDAIVYHIFPERFCDGDASNNPENAVPWGSTPTGHNFMGGDLKGIAEKIEYIADLGVNMIYLNPIFESCSNHKYDTTDYFKIDPQFGDLDDLKNLVKRCHEKGIRIILDGVFNHCGILSGQFQDVIEKGEKSQYKDWFFIENYPANPQIMNYECVGYYNCMPKLRMSNPEVRKYFLDVVRYWMEETGIDGWRLDVSDEIEATFLREMRALTKSIKADSFILGETWKENLEMLKGDQVDSIMNYLFWDSVVGFFAKGSIESQEFNNRINRFLGNYSRQVRFSLYNLIGSHDTTRFLTFCNGDHRRMKAAIAFQMCFPGIPAIYYGDEIGMDGENDPGCRRTMIWDESLYNRELLEWYKKLVKIRKSSEVLRQGDYKCNYCNPDNGVYAFFRELGNDRFYIVINSTENAVDMELPIIEGRSGKKLKDEISGNEFEIEPLRGDSYYNDDIYSYSGVVNLNVQAFQVYILPNNR